MPHNMKPPIGVRCESESCWCWDGVGRLMTRVLKDKFVIVLELILEEALSHLNSVSGYIYIIFGIYLDHIWYLLRRIFDTWHYRGIGMALVGGQRERRRVKAFVNQRCKLTNCPCHKIATGVPFRTARDNLTEDGLCRY